MSSDPDRSLPSASSPSAGPSRPMRAASASPEGSPIRAIFPGFLSPNDPDEDDQQSYGISPSSSGPPSPGLPYLLQSSPAQLRKSLEGNDDSPTHMSTSHSDTTSTIHPSSDSTVKLPTSAGSSVASSSARSSFLKKRPSPLALKHSEKAIGTDEEMASQRDQEGPRTGISIVTDSGPSSLSTDFNDLSILRNTLRQNLRDRPLDSPLSGQSDSDSSGFRSPFPEPTSAGLVLPDHITVPIEDLLSLLHSSTQLLILDTRPLGSFLDAHLPRSANISIPTLIFKRFRKAVGTKPTWASLGSFISTPAGSAVWTSIDLDQELEVVVVGTTPIDEMARVLREVMDGLVRVGRVRVLRGAWDAVEDSPTAQQELVDGEQSLKSPPPSNYQPPASAPFDPTSFPAPPPIPPSEAPRIAPRISLPSLKSESIAAKRSVPSLSVNTGYSHRSHKIALHDKPARSATLGSFSSHSKLQAKSPGLRINTSAASKFKPGDIPNVSVTAPKSPAPGSFQALCHAQSKMPPSPSSFGDVTTSFDGTNSGAGSSRTPKTPLLTPRNRGPGNLDDDLHPRTAVPGSARNGVAPFIVSTILPNFLYLGPEIVAEEEVVALQKMGVKRILNVALECNDEEGLKLRERFDRYFKVPMRDIVEETGMRKGMRDACDFLDDARLHSSPTYVHCKAGKSRSVTVVLAYLIHANAWTLKTAYAYVAERRKGISPNIGFVAELMQFEEAELGLKQSGGVHGEGSAGRGGNHAPREGDSPNDRKDKREKARHMRESLPPAWSAASLDSRPVKSVPPHGEERPTDPQHPSPSVGTPGGRNNDGEKEVRKNGQWVHQRRAPVDRTTLQPGRRASKAGLESLRPLAPATTMSTSQSNGPIPSPTVDDDARRETATPGGEGRLGWI